MRFRSLAKNSIFVRIFIACVVPFICVFLILALAINQVAYYTITDVVIETSLTFANEIAERINDDHDNTRALLEWVSDRLITVDPSNPNAVTEISDFLHSLLVATPYLHCIWFVFEADGFYENEHLSMDFVRSDGEIILLFDLDLDILHDPVLAPWYVIPYNTGEVWFETADYYDYGIGGGHMYTDTVSMPLIRNGQTVGVAGIDTLYENQFHFIGATDIAYERTLKLLTRDGEIVYSGDNTFVTEFIYDLQYADNDIINGALNSDHHSIIDAVSPIYGVRSVMTFTPVYAEHASQQLYLYIDMPANELLRPASYTTQMIIIISIASLLVLGILLLLIIRHTLKPVQKLTETANRIADGELDTDVALEIEGIGGPSDSLNEIVMLSNSMKKMIDRLRHAQALEIREQALVAENDMLDRLNTMKNLFFQDMSHDFKTPLTVISVNILDSVHMLDYEVDFNELRENLNNAQSEIMRMSRMVDNTIKQAAGQGTRQGMAPLDLAILLREGAETYRTLLERNGNTLILDIPQTLPKVYGSADTLFLVISNILSNATRHTRNGEITISASSGEKGIHVSVKDTGAGIKPELLPSVFQRGVSESGSGLGLSICKSAIDAHNGTISIESELNKGTTVYFTIPVITDNKS